MLNDKFMAGLSLGGDLGEKVSLIRLTSSYFELREVLMYKTYRKI